MTLMNENGEKIICGENDFSIKTIKYFFGLVLFRASWFDSLCIAQFNMIMTILSYT